MKLVTAVLFTNKFVGIEASRVHALNVCENEVTAVLWSKRFAGIAVIFEQL